MPFEYAAPATETELPHLASIRARRRLVWILFWTYLPGTAIVGGVLGRLLNSDRPFIVIAVVWIIAFMVSGSRVAGCRCPRCGLAFHQRGLWHNTFARRCLNCGLPLRASRPAA
jgi:hypothetical protein